jgi:hypothetical protein
MSDQARLATLLQNTTRYVLRDRSGQERSRSADPTVLEALRAACRIEQTDTNGFCMCGGDFTVVLYGGRKKLAEVTNHHGQRVRFTDCTSDGTLTDGAAWRAWLVAHGAPEVDADWFDSGREGGRGAWVAAMPPSLRGFWDEMLAASDARLVAPDASTLRAAMVAAVPETHERITQLLFWLGAGHRSWLGPWAWKYEQHPLVLLALEPIDEVVAVSLDTTNVQTIEGAARFFLLRDKVPFRFPYELKHKLWERVQRFHDEEVLQLARKVFRL